MCGSLFPAYRNNKFSPDVNIKLYSPQRKIRSDDIQTKFFLSSLVLTDHFHKLSMCVLLLEKLAKRLFLDKTLVVYTMVVC